MWRYHVAQNEKGMHAVLAWHESVAISAVGGELDEVWEFASAIERAAEEWIIPLIGVETGSRTLS